MDSLCEQCRWFVNDDETAEGFAILSLMRMNISDFYKAAQIKPAVILARMAENMK